MVPLFFSLPEPGEASSQVPAEKCADSLKTEAPPGFSLSLVRWASTSLPKLPFKCFKQFIVPEILIQVSRNRSCFLFLHLSNSIFEWVYLSRFQGGRVPCDLSSHRGPDFQFVHIFLIVKLKSNNSQALHVRSKARTPNSEIFNNYVLLFILFSITFIINFKNPTCKWNWCFRRKAIVF